MPIDDPRFEDYLKTFRPVDPPALELKDSRKMSRSSRFWWTWTSAAAAIVIAAFLTWHRRTPDRIEVTTSDAQCCVAPLTVDGANASIFGPAPTTEALDRMVFPQPPKLPEGQQSALSVLGEQKAEL
jgi:hypothetical protein